MNKLVTLLVAAVLLSLFAASAAEAAPSPQINRLQAQVKRLKQQLREARATRDQFELEKERFDEPDLTCSS